MEGPTSPEDERQTPFQDTGGLTTSRLMPLVSRRRFSRPPSFAEARNSTQFVSNLRLDNLAPCSNGGKSRTVASPLLWSSKTRNQLGTCPMMSFSLSQRDTACRSTDRISLSRLGAWLRP